MHCVNQFLIYLYSHYFIEKKNFFFLAQEFKSTGVVWKTQVTTNFWLYVWLPLPLAKVIMLNFNMMLDVIILRGRKVLAALRSWLAKMRQTSVPSRRLWIPRVFIILGLLPSHRLLGCLFFKLSSSDQWWQTIMILMDGSRQFERCAFSCFISQMFSHLFDSENKGFKKKNLIFDISKSQFYFYCLSLMLWTFQMVIP